MKIALALALSLSTSAFAASPPPVSSNTILFGNDGYVTAANAGRNGPIMKFCPPGNFFSDVSGEDYEACGPFGKSTMMLGHHESKNVVDSVTAQQFLDKKFGAGKTEVVGVAPAPSNGSSSFGRNSLIFYRIKK